MNLLFKVISGYFLSHLLSFSCWQKNTLGIVPAGIIKSDVQNFLKSNSADNNLFIIGQEHSINYYFQDSVKKEDSVLCGDSEHKFSGNSEPYHPDLKPPLYTIKVIADYPHNIKAYTQGLFYDNGYLYEGTGQTGQSTLRKVKLETGESVKVLNLPPDIFGEGVASVGNYLYQLTYKNNVAYKYDKNTFELVNKLYFPMKEGWGLAYDGKNLLMTDGTENIYFLEPEFFTELKHITVYDDKGPINNLNELEFINDEIWANIYTTDTIIRINPETGKVTGKIIVKDILKQEDYHPTINFLNGIAYDIEKDRIFITGKNWPKLFEIKLVKK